MSGAGQQRLGQLARVAMLCIGTLLAAAVAAARPVPVALAPYVHGDRFDAGDYGWMRGAFADAPASDKAAWSDVTRWLSECQVEAQRTAVRMLVTSGVDKARLPPGPYRDVLCGAVSGSLPRTDQGEVWTAFQSAVAQARPVADTILWSATLAQTIADGQGRTSSESLRARPTYDQLLRTALTWNADGHDGAPPLDPAARGIVEGRIWAAIRARDQANAAWLDRFISRNGWPTFANAGKVASHSAWLIVQHADDDPTFQYRMLRRMEPLARQRAIDRADVAMLSDRVMLKIVGAQRYGTQAICQNGVWTVDRLDDPAHVDVRRAAAGMSSMAANLTRIERQYGPCPKIVSIRK